MKSAPPPSPARGFAIALVLLVALLGRLFAKSFQPDSILFSSDGPLGNNAAAYAALPDAFSGMWLDLNWVGGPGGSAFPSLTYLLLWALGPLYFAKFYAPSSLLFLGLATWVCCRQLGFRPFVATLGAVAAALNTGFFSYACWGLGTVAFAAGWTFLAVAALSTHATPRGWLRAVLAGFATGMAVVEGFDQGAILSLFVAGYAVHRAWEDSAGRRAGARWAAGAGRTAVVAIAAAILAAQALAVLIGTQVKGVAGMAQDSRTRAQRWDEATQWSLPKVETLRVLIPGLFGYRMDTPDGGNYWGRVGERPGMPGTRHSGAGVFGGVVVCLLALFALTQSLRGAKGVFSAGERRAVWFWGGALVVSLLLAWGRHAPFYQFFYALPYFSTIRNPIKFMHPFSVALVILFGYGLHALAKGYLTAATDAAGRTGSRLRTWWARANAFDRRWVRGLLVGLGAAALGWLLYTSARKDLLAHLGTSFPPELTAQIAGFSFAEVGRFVLILALASGVLVLVLSGILGGERWRAGVGALGALALFELVRANTPWVNYWTFTEKYSPTWLTETLRQRPYEQRVALFRFPVHDSLNLLQQIFDGEWTQHGFRYFNIQSLDVVQEPRPTVENQTYRAALNAGGPPGYVRLWQLTNTRYLIGLAGAFTDTVLNQHFDGARKRFRLLQPFTVTMEKAGAPLVVETNQVGPFALIEFTGALPRARLYSSWLVDTNDATTLATLTSPAHDPALSVLVSTPLPAGVPPAAAAAPDAAPGNVEFASYAPKYVRLRATANQPAILLLNDKFDPNWSARVNGQPAELLRCNYLMRGVYLPAGTHEIEFSYHVSLGPLMVSVSAIAFGLALLGWVIVGRRARARSAGPDPAAAAAA
jgi:hypothetical protein